MIKLKKLSMSNFWSFGKEPVELDLENIGHVLVQGHNKDIGSEGESRNGVGKTVCMNGILFSLYGKGVDNSKMKPDDMVNLYNEKKMVVTIDLEIDGTDYTISRGRKPAFVELHQGSVSLTRDSMKNTDAEIQKLLGIPYEVFMGVYFMNPDIPTFMSMTPADQRNYVESVLSLDVLAQRAETLKATRKDFDMELKLVERDLENAKNLEKQMNDTLDRLRMRSKTFEEEKSTEIQSLEETLREASGVDFDGLLESSESIDDTKIREIEFSIQSTEQDIKMLESSKVALEKELSQIDETIKKKEQFDLSIKEKKQKIQDSLSGMKDEVWYLEQQSIGLEIQTLKEDIKDKKHRLEVSNSRYEQFVVEVEKMLSELDVLKESKCPYCLQDHHDEIKIQEIEKSLSEKEEDLDIKEKAIDDLSSSIASAEKHLSELEETFECTDADDCIKTIKRMKSELENFDETNPYDSSVESLRDKETIVQEIEDFSNKINDKIQHLDELENQINIEKKSIDSVKNELINSIGTFDPSEIRKMMNEFDSISSDLEKVKSKENPYSAEIEEASKGFPDIKGIEDHMSDISEKREHVNYLIKLLTDPKSFVRKNIVDQYVPYVNKKINEYSEKLGLGHVSEINADMTVDIQYMQKNVSYFNMSKGERLRMNLATSLAFKDLLELLGKKVNMCMVDEYLDSALDTSGMNAAFKLLKEKQENLLLITHREELSSSMDRTMLVTKQNSFSRIDIL